MLPTRSTMHHSVQPDSVAFYPQTPLSPRSAALAHGASQVVNAHAFYAKAALPYGGYNLLPPSASLAPKPPPTPTETDARSLSTATGQSGHQPRGGVVSRGGPGGLTARNIRDITEAAAGTNVKENSDTAANEAAAQVDEAAHSRNIEMLKATGSIFVWSTFCVISAHRPGRRG